MDCPPPLASNGAHTSASPSGLGTLAQHYELPDHLPEDGDPVVQWSLGDDVPPAHLLDCHEAATERAIVQFGQLAMCLPAWQDTSAQCTKSHIIFILGYESRVTLLHPAPDVPILLSSTDHQIVYHH